MANAVFNGPPSNFVAPASGQPNTGLDAVNGVEYYTGPVSNGWLPVTSTVARANAQAQVANNANLLTYVVPASAIYEIDYHAISVNTPTAATLAGLSATYTDADTGVTASVSIAATSNNVGAPGVVNNGVLVVHPKVGTNLVLATTNYGAGSGTALSYNAYVRVSFLG